MSGDLHLQAAGASAGAGDVTVLLLALALIVAVARVFGRLATWVGQPPVIGEIVAGVLLGPTLLGGTAAVVFPDGIRPCSPPSPMWASCCSCSSSAWS